MVKVFRLKKHYRNGTKEHDLVLKEHQCDSDDSVEYYVTEWCDNEPSGQVYGWRVDWEEVTEAKAVKQAIQNKIDKLNKQVTYLENEKMEWEDQLELIKV